MKITEYLTIGTLLSALVLAPSAQASKLYRYKNDQGNTVVDDHVPPEHVKKGYEILSRKGVVIGVVPRELTPEEQKRADAEEWQAARAKKEEQRLREWDQSLMLRYSTIEDIEAARERALMDLRIRVSILKGNKRSLKQQIENYQTQAAEMERLGHQVDDQRLRAIEDLQSEIAVTERAIVDREKEIDAVNASYTADVDRFTMLLDLVEFRRQQSVKKEDKYGDLGS
ncbi:hypothetical protein [Halioglobus maricola]|uniref:hypothetical protein n=1 Tax=Halioglobus maricola TaxID=2601894 RepID=UPI001F0E1DC3|nr:hypothetical protein [Halioglobus maricola]